MHNQSNHVTYQQHKMNTLNNLLQVQAVLQAPDLDQVAAHQMMKILVLDQILMQQVRIIPKKSQRLLKPTN